VVLDYGRNVSGRPWLDLGDVEEPTQLRLSYSECAAWAGPDGDMRGSHNASASEGRVEEVTAVEPGRIVSSAIQGGQRFQRIALETPGTVAITAAGIHFSAYRATAAHYQGWFMCSSEVLTRIWFDSAYTTQLNQLPANTLPVPWSTDGRALVVDGGTLAVLRGARDWTDVTVSFETRVLDNAAGWVVRAEDDGARGYLIALRAPEGDEPATLQWSYFDDGYEGRPQDTVRRYTPLGEFQLDADFDPSDWHHIRTTAVGRLLDIEIDGVTVTRIDLGDLPGVPFLTRGSVGFHAAWRTSRVPGERASFRDFTVAQPHGEELFRHSLADDSALACFTGDGVTSPDPLPVILDGARRDRSVWSGDLIVQIPNIFHTTWAEDYVRGSIELLNGHQEADGRLAARLPPLFPPVTPPQHGQVYSAVYSMHQVSNLALYHLYTGDVAFVRAQWPAIVRQLAYDHSRVDDRGLYITSGDEGKDWDWYDGDKHGAVSAYNVVYCHVLRQASILAAAIGEDAAAEDLAARAQRSRTAINAHLYDQARGLYVLSDLRPDAVAQDANALAVVHGIAPDGQAARILTALDAVLPRTPYGPQPFSADTGFRESISPFTSGFHLDALFTAGLTDQAFALLHDLWGHMAAPGPFAAGTVWELLNTDGSPGFGTVTSLAHGWACAPTAALSSHVLGVQPRSAAYRTWSVAPQTGPLTWARGQVPTPTGPIEVHWSTEGSALVLDVVAPADTSGTITVPAPAGREAKLRGTTTGGRLELSKTVPPGATTVTFDGLPGGRYTVTT